MRDLEKDYEELCREGLKFIRNCDLLADARLEVTVSAAQSLGSLFSILIQRQEEK